MAGIFKAYDIRGIYGDTLDEELALKIGRAFATFVKPKKIVVGQDMRPHSEPLFNALAEGLAMQGVDVVRIGMCSTPMSNFANGLLKTDASIMITASHNPGEWNGFKFARENAIPISGDTGIYEIEKIVMDETFDAPSENKGTVSEYDVKPEYYEHIRKLADVKRPVKIAADMANSMGIAESKVLEGLLEVDAIFDDYDGTFPNHEANPLKESTLVALQEKMRSGSYDFGIAFDGDADRVGFLDENGDVIPMDLTSALIAGDILSKEKSVILYDLRSSWAVKEVIEENGGTPLMSRVGHSFIKQQMRDNDASFAGELSGHYYFKQNYFTESSSLATLCIANIISKSGKKLSELVAPIKRYFASGEINSTVADTDVILANLKEKYSDGNIFELDGVSVEYEDWWFNVRCSNTEPLIRLNLEAKNEDLMKEKREEVVAIIRG